MNENLNQYVQNILVSSNWNIVSQTDSSVILGRSKKVSHIMHFILSILTGGALVDHMDFDVCKKERTEAIY